MSKKNKSGFTLLEVLITLSVLSISMLGIYTLLQMSIGTTIRAKEKLFVIERGYDRLSRQINYPSKVYSDIEEYEGVTVRYTFERNATAVPTVEEIKMKVATDKAETEFIYYSQSGKF